MTDFTKTITNSVGVLGTPSKWSSDSPAHGDALIWGSGKWGDTNLIELISKQISDSQGSATGIDFALNKLVENQLTLSDITDMVWTLAKLIESSQASTSTVFSNIGKLIEDVQGSTSLVYSLVSKMLDGSIALDSAVQRAFNQVFEDVNEIVTLNDVVTVELWIDSLYKVVWGGTTTNKVAQPHTTYNEATAAAGTYTSVTATTTSWTEV
ncbi:MAG TPA: hypothetical protein P5110_07575 [Candidatus Omnitrophota bacterium]|nr:hypothetical protein [Candidatus Omnitrophota bacterium]